MSNGNIFSRFWHNINKILVPRNARVEETNSNFVVTLQNAKGETKEEREDLVTFSIPKGTSFTQKDRTKVDAALDAFSAMGEISSTEWAQVQCAAELVRDVNNLSATVSANAQNISENTQNISALQTATSNFVYKEGALETVKVNSDWTMQYPLRIWTKGDQGQGEYGFICKPTGPSLYNVTASADTWIGLTNRNIDNKWQDILDGNPFSSNYPTNKVCLIYKNDYLRLLYIDIWAENVSTDGITFKGGWQLSSDLGLIQNTASPLYKPQEFFQSYHTLIFSHSDIKYGYYVGQGWAKKTDGSWTDANMFLVKDNTNTKRHLISTSVISDVWAFKFSAIIPYRFLGLSGEED